MQGKCTNLFLGYAVGLNSDLGVRSGFESDLGECKYQKLENCCPRLISMLFLTVEAVLGIAFKPTPYPSPILSKTFLNQLI